MEEKPIKISAKEKKIIEKTTDELIRALEIDGSAEFSYEDEGAVNVVLETQDTGIVIGYHGEVLEALQLILAFCISKKVGRFIRVSLEVGDYKKNRTDWLQTLALQAKERVMQEKKEVLLPNLKSWERRVVHILLQEDADVSSESVGEGKERTLVIRPK